MYRHSFSLICTVLIYLIFVKTSNMQMRLGVNFDLNLSQRKDYDVVLHGFYLRVIKWKSRKNQCMSQTRSSDVTGKIGQVYCFEWKKSLKKEKVEENHCITHTKSSDVTGKIGRVYCFEWKSIISYEKIMLLLLYPIKTMITNQKRVVGIN